MSSTSQGQSVSPCFRMSCCWAALCRNGTFRWLGGCPLQVTNRKIARTSGTVKDCYRTTKSSLLILLFQRAISIRGRTESKRQKHNRWADSHTWPWRTHQINEQEKPNNNSNRVEGIKKHVDLLKRRAFPSWRPNARLGQNRTEIANQLKGLHLL